MTRITDSGADGGIARAVQKQQRYGRTPAAADYVQLSVPTLEKDRLTGSLGIPFIKVGKAVLYDFDLLDEWLAKHRRPSASEANP